jgi:PAS domain S-box-containing protein
MKQNQDPPADAVERRRRAEERLAGQRTEDGGQRTEGETARLVHGLQVRQIELEMQNEELGQARAQAETLLAQYTDLYDFAPAGYLTLDREGAIRQVNLTGARLFGVERTRLMNRRFGPFVAAGDRRAFSAFLEKVFANPALEGCEVTLSQEGSLPLVVRIEGTRSADGQECRAVVLDLTERKRSEAALRQKMEALRASHAELEQFNRAMVGREMRMIELKQEINELSQRLGEPPRHEMDQFQTGRIPGAGPAPAPPGGGGA